MAAEGRGTGLKKSGTRWLKIAGIAAGGLLVAAVFRVGFVRSEICEICIRNNALGFGCGGGGFTGVPWIDRVVKIPGGRHWVSYPLGSPN